jgi:hypothetical protein
MEGVDYQDGEIKTNHTCSSWELNYTHTNFNEKHLGNFGLMKIWVYNFFKCYNPVVFYE